MKKSIALFLLATFAIAFISSAVFSVNYPSPTGYVNDFAGIIPQDVQEKIEASISEYEKQTSIEIAVVTTKSLDGLPIEDWTIGLASRWGVGKKEKDNGIVFAIAPNEREMRIEVGYGLEGEMNDAKAGIIMDEYVIPHFKEGNYALGIEKATEAIMNTLGRISMQVSMQERGASFIQRIREEQERAAIEAEERKIREAREAEERVIRAEQQAEQRRIAAANAKEAFKKFMSVLLVLVAAGGVFISIFFLVKGILSSLKERRRKEALAKSVIDAIAEMYDTISQLQKRAKEAEKLSKSFPQWARNAADSSLKNARELLSNAEKDCDMEESYIKKEPDKANETINKIKANIQKSESLIASVKIDLPEEIKHYEKLASEKLADAAELLAEADVKLDKAKSEGLFKDGRLDKILDDAEAELGKNGACLSSDKSKAREICDSLESTREKISSVIREISKITETRNETEAIIQELLLRAGRIESEKPRYEELLEGMKRDYPEENWKDILGSFALVAGLVESSRSLADSAKNKNSVEQQDFYYANTDAKKARENLGKAESIFASIEQRKDEIEQAKQSHATELYKAELKVESALQKVEHSDVSNSARIKAREAEAKLREARRIAESGGMINWLSLALMIAAAAKLAGEAETTAMADINDAERRRREAEERRRREIEDEERRRRRAAAAAASAYASRRSSSSSSSHRSGFGGGRFGGGGASRKW